VRRFGIAAAAAVLSGALIVDPPGEAVADRVFVMGIWLDAGSAGDPQRKARQFAVIRRWINITFF